MGRRRHKWNEIKTEYITGKASYQHLAKKYSIGISQIRKIGAKEHWVDERNKYRNDVVSESVNNIKQEEISSLSKIGTMAESLLEQIENLLTDDKQFNRYTVKTREDGHDTVKEVVLGKYDTKAIRDISSSMKDLTGIIRNVYGLPTVQEQQDMDIAREKLKFTKSRYESLDDTSNELGVIIMPPVLVSDE